ncbi:MAG: hypothetical protein H6574_22680 [Lewinellaceae bacterium]|nr:hypothetical protein [Saprospiraceae bacterium]MCB9333871.1 hypothetical protein [Lewinellaceae bacterium]
MRLLFLLLFFTNTATLFSQPPKFHGKPSMIEEASYEVDSITGKQDINPRWTLIYHFDEAGRLDEHWLKNPGMARRDKIFNSHTVHQYQDGRLWKSTEYNADGEIRETQEHLYDAAGKLIRIKKSGVLKKFDQDMDVQTDSLERIIWIKTRYPKSDLPTQFTTTVYSGDTLAVSTTRDSSGNLLQTWTHRLNQYGDPLEIVQTLENDSVNYRAGYAYRYDTAGNWVERRSGIFSVFRNTGRYTGSKEIRRIVYPALHPDTLSAKHLHGNWADFQYGLELQIFADGNYLALTNGQRNDGGAWTLDTQNHRLLITGKENRETPVELNYRFEDGLLILYRSGKEGEFKMVKLQGVNGN